MTHQEFLQLIQQPDTVHPGQLSDLKEYVLRYPYFYQANLLYLKALQQSEDVMFDNQLSKVSLYTSDKHWLFYYLYPEAALSNKPKDLQREEQLTGSYFDLLDSVEASGGDTRTSLREIAEKLKASRAALQESKSKKETPTQASSEPQLKAESAKFDGINHNASLEEQSKQYIKQKKYREAIVLLQQLNLINPEKSIYFADQIRFLEKIIENTK